MIKINGLNYKKGSGSYLLFGQYFIGDGYGDAKETRSHWFFSGWGDGDCFGDGYGHGTSSSKRLLKIEFSKR